MFALLIMVHNRWAWAPHARVLSFYIYLGVWLQLACVDFASWSNKQTSLFLFIAPVYIWAASFHLHAVWSFKCHVLHIVMGLQTLVFVSNFRRIICSIHVFVDPSGWKIQKDLKKRFQYWWILKFSRISKVSQSPSNFEILCSIILTIRFLYILNFKSCIFRSHDLITLLAWCDYNVLLG